MGGMLARKKFGMRLTEYKFALSFTTGATR